MLNGVTFYCWIVWFSRNKYCHHWQICVFLKNSNSSCILWRERGRCVICISLIRDGLTNTKSVLARDTECIADLIEKDHSTVKMKSYVAVVLTVLYVTSTQSASPRKNLSPKRWVPDIVKTTRMKLFLDRAIEQYSHTRIRAQVRMKYEERWTLPHKSGHSHRWMSTVAIFRTEPCPCTGIRTRPLVCEWAISLYRANLSRSYYCVVWLGLNNCM